MKGTKQDLEQLDCWIERLENAEGQLKLDLAAKRKQLKGLRELRSTFEIVEELDDE